MDVFALFMAFLFLFLEYCAFLFFWWPGIMTPDSGSQYSAAISGIYGDHHPFLMSAVWHYLDKIHKGPGLMLTLHLSLLFLGLFFLMRCVPKKYRLWILLLPLMPQIFCYSGMIWKDVGMAFSFMLVGSALGYETVNNRSLSLGKTALLFVPLLYGTMIKFQAQYLAPFLLVWMGLSFAHYQVTKKWLFSTIGLLLSFYASIAVIEKFGPTVTQQHSWQMVKLFDLAAISTALDENFIPSANQTCFFSFEKMKKAFSPEAVDSLVYIDEPLVQKGSTEEERQHLWDVWFSTLLHHPLEYAYHRGRLLAQIFIDHGKVIPERFGITKGHIFYKPACIIIAFSHPVYLVLRSHLFPLLCSIVLLFFSCVYRCRASVPVFFLNATGLSMVCVLSAFSMAATNRYTYIMVVLFATSLPFAWLCMREKYQKRIGLLP